ncbi:MAG: hypothetical protein M1319_06135 [Chloroflexi bacterium]|nr:hypothetical protein [Chloroflexota bacterium]
MRTQLPLLSPAEREETILREMSAALQETYGNYVLTFRFMDRDRDRTSHYLVFVTKHYRGYEIMKEIMGKESQKDGKGVPMFEFDEKKVGQLMLSGVSPAMDHLVNDLPMVFAGRTLTMKQIYDNHNVGTRYIKKNYKDALTTILEGGLISTNRPQLRAGTFGDDVVATFPVIRS